MERAEWERMTCRKLLKALDEAVFWLERIPAEGSDEHQATRQGTFRLGEAGGIAFSGQFAGTTSEALFEEISDAVEMRDLDRVREIRSGVESRSRSGGDPAGAASGEDALDWDAGYLQMLAVLSETRQARETGDEHRYSVMAGFLSGLMHWDTGLDRYRSGSLRDAVIAAYNDGWGAALWVEWEGIRDERLAGGSLEDPEDPDLLLRWVGLRLAAADRMTGPLFFSRVGESDDERSERESSEREHFLRSERSVQLAQSFGARVGRGETDEIRLPTSYVLNRALVLSSHKKDHEGEDGAADDPEA